MTTSEKPMTTRHIRKCDRCGHEESPEEHASGKWARLQVAHGSALLFSDGGTANDICPSCFDALERWWANKGTEAAPRDGALPPLATRATDRVIAHGSEKHGGPGSYLTSGVPVTTHIAALSRHLAAARLGELADEDSGEHPLAHVVARGLIALELTLREVKEREEMFERQDTCPHLDIKQDSSGSTCQNCGRDWLPGEPGAGE